MKMIVGLGNIGPQYDRTRHNTGFMVVEQFAQAHGINIKTRKMNAKYGSGFINNEKVIVVEPTTFMNDSGIAVKPLMDYFDIPVENIAIVHDDMDLPVGKIRVKDKGSAGGHNGIKSIIYNLGTENFTRVRVGTGHPDKANSVVNYVLADSVRIRFRYSNKLLIMQSTRWTIGWMALPFQILRIVTISERTIALRLDQLFTKMPQYAELVSGLKPQSRQLVTGIGGSARTVLINNLINSTKRPMIIVVDTLFHADQLVNDLANIIDDNHLFEFPVEEMGAAELATSSPEYKAQRVLALNQLASGNPAVIVTSVSGIRRLVPARVNLWPPT